MKISIQLLKCNIQTDQSQLVYTILVHIQQSLSYGPSVHVKHAREKLTTLNSDANNSR